MAGWDETQEIGSDYVKVMYDHQLTLREQAQIVIDNLDAQTIAQMFQPDWFDVVQEIAEKMWSDYTTSQKLERLTASQYAQFKGVDVPKGTKLPELMSSFGVYDRRAVEWLQDYNFELIQRVKEDIRYGIKGSIMQGVAIGEDNKQIANRVRNYVTKPMPIYRKADMMAVEAGKKTMKDIRPIRFISPEHRSMMIARTESMRVFNQANFSQYQENGIERVAMSKHAGECKICVEKRIEGPWNIVDAPYLPLHPFCRHTYIPLVDPKSIMQDFRDLTQQSYGKTVGENPFQSGMDFVGNWKQGQKDKVKHAFNQLPDHLRSSRFLNEGVIQMDPLQHFGSKIVDGRHVIVGSDWTDERIITELMNSYGRLWYGRYQLQLMEHFGKKVDEIRFGEYFARYFNDPTSITDSGIRDFFEKSVFRDSFKPKEFHPDDVVRPIIEKPNIPVPKTFLKADYGANDPIRFIDENGLKWYAKPGSKDSLDMEKAVWELANDLGVRTYPDLIVAKADDVPKDLLEHWTDRQYLDGIIFTREIDGENVSKSLLEPEFFLKNNKDDIRKIAALDVLVGNSDRHYGNFMYDYKNLYAIDHGDCGWKDYVTNYFLNDLENKATTKAGFDDWVKDTFGDILNRFDRTDLNKWKGVKARDGDFIEILTNNRKNFFANIREDMDNYDFWKEEIPTKMSISGKEWEYKDDFIRYFNTLPEEYRMDVNVNVGTVLDGEFEYGFKGNTFNIYSSQDPKELIHEYIEKFIWPHYKDNGYIEYKSDFSELFFKFSQGKFNTPYTSEEKELKDFFTNLKPIQPPIEKRLVRFVDVNDDSTLNEVFILEDNLGEKWYAKATSKENAEIEKGMWNLARDLNVNTYPELHILNFSDLDEMIISQIDDLYPHILEDMEYPLLVTKNIGDNSINLRRWNINHDISEGNVEEIKRMFLLDMIGGNHDRNWGNVLINDGHFYAIDHEFSGNRFSINTINHLAMEWLDHKLYRGEFDDWFEKEFRSLVDEASEIDYSKFKFARDEKGMNLIYNVGNVKENMRDFISTNNLWKKDPSKGMEIDISRASTLQKQIVKDAFDLIPNRLKTHDSYFIQFSDARTMGLGTTRLRINKDASPENIKGEIWDHFAKSIFREYQDDIAKYKWNMSMFGTIFREYMEKGPGAPGVEKEIEQMLDILKIRPKSQKLVSESPLKLVAKKVDFKGDLPVYFKQDMNQLISLLPPEMRVDVTFRRMGKKIKPDEGEVKIIHDIYGRELIVSGVEGYARRVAKINGFDENKFVKDLKSFFDGENVDLSKYVVETPKPTLSPKVNVDHKNKRAIVEVVQDTPVAKPTKSFSNLSDSEKYVMDNFDYSKTDTIKELAGYFYRGRLENYIKAIRNNDIKKINHYKNLKLKDGFLTDHEELIPKNTTFNDIGKHLTELINENKIKEDLMVFRGGEDLKGYKIGDVLENNRYVATSLNKDYAKGYIGDNYLTKIILPEGTPALSVEKIWKQVEEKYGKGLYKYKNESELLLDNINFKIIDIDHKNKTATMEVLNEKSIPKVEGRAFEKIDFKGDLPGYFKKDMQKIIDDLPDDFKVGATFKRMGKTVTPKENEIKIIYDIKGDELLQFAKDGYKDLLYKKFPDRKKEIDEAFGAKKVVEPKAKIKAPKNKKPSDYRNIYNEGIDKDNLTNWVKNNYNYGNSKKDKEAIRDYATSGFKDINPTLRNKDKLDPDDYFDADRIERIKNLKEVLNKYELKEDMVLYRNMGETNYFKNLKAGDIFKDLAPLSTTVDKKLANNWNWIQKDDTWVATIYANKGTKGVFTNGLYEAQKEGEFIIKPEQSLQIISIDKKNKKVVLQTVDVKKSESPVENVPYHFDKQPSKTLTDKDTWIESKNIDELGNHMKTLDNEVMAMFNKKGEILYTSKGDAMGVDWSAEKLDEADAIIHNHPGTSIGFSPQDMITHVEEQQYHNFREFNIAGNNLYELEVYDTRKFIDKSIDVLSPDLTSEYIEKVCREIQYDLRGVNPYKEARKVVGSQQKYAKLFDTKGNFTDPILYKEYTEELTRKAREIVDKKQVESYMQYINELGQEWGFRVNRYDYDKIDIKDLARQKVETTPFPTKVDKVVKTSKSPRDIKPLIIAEDASEIPKVEQRLEYERGINPGMKFKDENGDIWYAKNIEANDLDKEEAGYQMAQAMNLKTYPEMRALRTEDVPSADRIRNAYDDYYLYTKEIPNEGDLDKFLEGEGNEFGRVPNKNQLKILGYNDTKIQEIHDRGYLFDEEEIEFDKRWVEHYKNQVYKVFVLDSAIGNQDRHLSNILVNGDDLLPIDHGILSKVETIDDEGKFIRCEPMDQLMIMGFMDRNSGDMLITKEDFLEELEPYFETMRSVNVDALQMSDSMKDMVKYNINHLEDVAKNFYDQTMINEGIVYLGW